MGGNDTDWCGSNANSGSPSMSARAALRKLGPYPSLMVLAVPLIILAPVKIAAVVFITSGKWLLGSGLLLGSYAAKLFGIEKLFKLLKPSIMSLRWFAILWSYFGTFRGWASEKQCRGA